MSEARGDRLPRVGRRRLEGGGGGCIVRMWESIKVEGSLFGWLTFCHAYSMSCEPCSFPNQRSLLGQQARHLSADELIRGRLAAVRVGTVGVANLPGPARGAIVIRPRLARRPKLCALGVEAVAVEVLSTTHGGFRGDCVRHEDGVVGSVDIGIDAKAE